MSKIFIKMPKGTAMLYLVVASALKNIFLAQMSLNSTVKSMGIAANYLSLFFTILFTGLIIALIVRLMILIGYKIANRMHIRMTSPTDNPIDRLYPINYTDFRSLAMGYIATAYLVSALLNIPMYLFPPSYKLCIFLGVAIELVFIALIALEIQKIVSPHQCRRAYVALLVPFGIIIAFRLLLGV